MPDQMAAAVAAIDQGRRVHREEYEGDVMNSRWRRKSHDAGHNLVVDAIVAVEK